MAGTAIPAMRPIPTGAPTSVPSCQRIFFFLDHGFFPQKVQPEGLKQSRGYYTYIEDHSIHRFNGSLISVGYRDEPLKKESISTGATEYKNSTSSYFL